MLKTRRASDVHQFGVWKQSGFVSRSVSRIPKKNRKQIKDLTFFGFLKLKGKKTYVEPHFNYNYNPDECN